MPPMRRIHPKTGMQHILPSVPPMLLHPSDRPAPPYARRGENQRELILTAVVSDSKRRKRDNGSHGGGQVAICRVTTADAAGRPPSRPGRKECLANRLAGCFLLLPPPRTPHVHSRDTA